MHKLPRTSVKAVGASQGPAPNAAINMSRHGKATRPNRVCERSARVFYGCDMRPRRSG